MAVPETRANHTIYINNLNEKIKKDGKFSGYSALWVISHELTPSTSSTRFLSAFFIQSVKS